MSDPFASIPAAQREDCELRTRAFAKPEERCGFGGKVKRKKVDLNPRQRAWFEKHGWTYERVEHSNAWGGMTKDLWGVGDYLACHPEHGIVLVQVTTGANAAARIKKAQNTPELTAWFASGGKFQVHAWKQVGGKGSRWEMEVREVTR
jgi:hypothetical protein